MKLSRHSHKQSTKVSVSYKDSFVEQYIGQFIYQWLPIDSSEFVIACIGSDRSTGDALGPLVGSLLSKRKHSVYHVYGTLEKPIHALNIKDRLDYIKQKHQNAFIVAVDACLGRSQSVGNINASIGPLRPGLALKKDLPEVGHLNITGIVNISSPIDFITLQNTRLNLVFKQAEIISRALSYAEYLFFNDDKISNQS